MRSLPRSAAFLPNLHIEVDQIVYGVSLQNGWNVRVIDASGMPTSGLREAWERGDRDQFLVDTLEEPIRYTEGGNIGIKR
jgi:hypothetical protein